MSEDLSDNWIKRESTSHPGKFFYLNTATGQKLWSLKQLEGSQGSSPPVNIRRVPPRLICGLSKSSGITKPTKTPAQDRLKSLQNVLKAEQVKTEEKPGRSSILDAFKKISGKLYSRLTQSSTTRTTTSADTISRNSRRKSTTKTPSPPKQITDVEDRTKTNITRFSNFIVAPRLTQFPANQPEKYSLKHHDIPETSTVVPEKSRTDKVEKPSSPKKSTIIPQTHFNIKEHIPVTRTSNELENKKPEKRKRKIIQDETEVKKIRKNTKKGNSIERISPKKPKDTKPLKHSLSYGGRVSPKKKQNVSNSLGDIPQTPSPYDFSEAKILSYQFNTSSDKPISANDRLKNLRKYLDKQTLESTTTTNNVKSVSLRDNMIAANNPMIVAATKALETTLNNEYQKFLVRNARCQDTSDTTPMDWDEIEVKINVEINKMRKTPEEDSSSLAEYYDVVKENLLKLSSESNTHTLAIRPNNFYIVIDTNVFLRNLTFVDDLTKQQIGNNGQTVIIVPYSVIQELDKLKNRKDDSVSTQAIRAIKYLNSKLEAQNESVKGQSAREAMRHIINIESADDSILNCCLQIKEESSNVVLLSNDVNLRNKAIINNVKTCTQEDLVMQQFDIS